MNSQYQVLSIDIQREYNRIPYAEIVLLDGDPVTQEFTISESDFFEVGSKIDIRLKYEGEPGDEEAVFKGIVVKKGLQLLQSGCKLTVELSDPCVSMTGSRKNAIFLNTTDGEVIGTLIGAHEGLDKAVTATTVKQPQLIQYGATDWDFMLCRAEANGMLVSVVDGKVTVDKPDLTGGPVLTMEFGLTEIYGFDLEADSRFQQETIQGSNWDVKAQDMALSANAAPFDLKQDKLNAAAMHAALGKNAELLVNGSSLSPDEAKAWADAKMMKDRLSVLKGSMKIDGTSLAQVGKTVTILGVSAIFSGDVLVTGIRHEVSTDGWYTHLQFGCSPEWFSSAYPVSDKPASGLIPGVSGLQIGVVLAIENDPDKEFRVQVKIPALGTENNTIWARLTSMDAGNNRGMFFMPEAKDEVILGFLNDDPRQAVILGSVYSSTNAAPLQPEAANPQKGIVTIKGLKLLFDDVKKTVTVSTSDDQQIILNEEEKTIVLKDKNNNSVKLSDAGIELTSGKDLILKAEGAVKVEASGKVEIKGSAVDVI
jgi:Rhs element Vgr protein